MSPAMGRAPRSTALPGRLGRATGAVLLATALSACSTDRGTERAAALTPIDVPAPPPAASPAPDERDRSIAPVEPVVDVGASLEVEDQRGDGRGVLVEYARMSHGSGYVSVQTADGWVLGSALLTRGTQPVTVPLEPRLAGSRALLAVLHADDGNGIFDPFLDPVVVDDGGEREDEEFDYVVS